MKQCYKAEDDSHKKTKLAYVDIAPKAPRSIRNAQVMGESCCSEISNSISAPPRLRMGQHFQLGTPWWPELPGLGTS